MSVIDDYLVKVNALQRKQLERIQKIVKKIAPDATETIGYGMPVFKYKGKYLIGFCEFKNHMSIFPGSEAIEGLKDKLDGYKLSKGTIQFTLDKPIPESIIKQLLLVRQKAITDKT